MHKYKLICKKGEGTFSEVLKAQAIKNGKYFAIKRMKNHFDSIEQVNNLREIQALRRLSPNPHVIKLQEVIYDRSTGRLALVFELMDMNIYELIRGRRTYVAEEKIKLYMYQLLKALDHMHKNGIFHRDIKPENILIMDDRLKLADFGSCRGMYSKQPFTEYISTRWYRAPECLLTDGYYNYKMDLWGAGCVFFEVMTLYPLFPGTDELDQIQKIHDIIGTPSPDVLQKIRRHNSAHMNFNFPPKQGSGIAKLMPHASEGCVDLITKMLAYNPDERLSARQALRHPYFRDLREAEKAAARARATPHSPITSLQPATPSRSSAHGRQSPATESVSTTGSTAAAAATGAPPRRRQPAPAPAPAPDASEATRDLPLIRVPRKPGDTDHAADSSQLGSGPVHAAGTHSHGSHGHLAHHASSGSTHHSNSTGVASTLMSGSPPKKAPSHGSTGTGASSNAGSSSSQLPPLARVAAHSTVEPSLDLDVKALHPYQHKMMHASHYRVRKSTYGRA